MKYLAPEDMEVDVLRAIYNRSNKYSIVILVGGHSQSGKTTAIWYMCNRICQLRKYGYRALDPNAPCNTWREWDGKNLSATSAQDFVRLWNNNQDAVLTLSEASTTMYYMDWMSVMARVFNSTTTVLGKQHNICFLDTVFESELMKKARHKIDFRIEIHKRDDANKRAEIRSGWTLIDYLGMKWMLIRYNTWILQYSSRMLLMAKQYTDWISETVKAEEARENERRVGLLPNMREEEQMRENEEYQKWIEDQKNKPLKTSLEGIL